MCGSGGNIISVMPNASTKQGKRASMWSNLGTWISIVDAELAELHHQLFRLHLVQCLDELKEQRKTIKEMKQRLVCDPAPDDWLVYTLPPSFALSNGAEPLAVVLNYTGQWNTMNRRIIAFKEMCASKLEKGSPKGSEERVVFHRRGDVNAQES